MVRLSRGKKTQVNTFGDDSKKNTQSRPNIRAPKEQERVKQVKEVSRAKNQINSELFSRSMRWFAFTFFIIGCMTFLAYGFYSLTNYFMQHPYFTTQSITVHGNRHFSQEEIIQLSGIEEGMSAFSVNLTHAQSRILQNPWIENVDIIRDLPCDFILTVYERVPQFWLQHENALYYVDSTGKIIAPVEASDFISLPILELGQSPEKALMILPDFITEGKESKALPFNFQDLAWFKLSAGKGIEMFWEEKQLLLSISIENWRENLKLLGHAIKDLEKRKEFNKVAEIHAGNEQVWFIRK